jgi:ABC-2 type transport system ATP-binding protein
MDVVERVCDRIVILDDGRIAAQGTFEELSSARGGASLERIFASLTGDQDQPARARRLVEALPGRGHAG